MKIILTATLIVSLGSCGGPIRTPVEENPEPDQGGELFVEVTDTHLPQTLGGRSMDGRPADVDADGDLDILVACEFCPNILLINDGTGTFADESTERLPQTRHDSEDIGVADFDGDGDLDVIVVSEDDRKNELYLNDGDGVFSDASDRLPVLGISNAVLVADVNTDSHPDILIGNNGAEAILINDGTGQFADESEARLPGISDVTQDLELGDVDGDGDLDLLVGNEDRNRLYLNDGAGSFSDVTEELLPDREALEETREADFGDVDGDGDLDIVFGNIRAFVPSADPQNRLLLNDGSGRFSDVTEDQLPAMANRSFDIDFIDIDGDGDLDVLTADAGQGRVFDEPIRVFLNDGSGRFSDGTGQILPDGISGKWFDIEAADFNGDGSIDLFLASQGSADRLLFGK